MFIIPGIVISIATFPGVIVHELAHLLMCKWRGVAVFDVCFFQFKNPSGYVIHEEPKDFTSAFAISFGPFLINSLLCIAICAPAIAPYSFFNVTDPLSMVLMWLGISIGAHAFPSNHDAKNVWQMAKVAAKSGNVLALISFPIVVVLFVANLLRFFWADFIYAFGIGFVLPGMLLKMVV
jgi:hypothetical protein